MKSKRWIAFVVCMFASLGSAEQIEIEKTQLFDKVYGSLIGAAIGDAMGGPVEFWDYRKIDKVHGKVTTLLPYERDLGPHGPWAKDAGAYTDDSRMNKIFCSAVILAEGKPSDKELARIIINYYHAAPDGLPKNFIEEYYYKAIYRNDKSVYGGMPTNGAIMGIAPVGLVNACDPVGAYRNSFEMVFTTEGYARSATAMAAAAIASAMKPDATLQTVIDDTNAAVKQYKHRVEGTLWPNTDLYQHVGAKCEQMMHKGIEIGRKHKDPFAMRPELIDNLAQPFGPDASESLAVTFAMLAASGGDYKQSVIGSVNYGRDNDSAASVAGAIAGALHGASAIPPEWIELIETTNPKPTFHQLAKEITLIIQKDMLKQKRIVTDLEKLTSQ